MKTNAGCAAAAAVRVMAGEQCGSGGAMRFFVRLLLCVGAAVALAGCVIGKPGPDRPITINDDVEMVSGLARPDIAAFSRSSLAQQASTRNEIVTARMYIADMQYHAYESQLTRDIETEGLAAALANIGLTTSATLIPVAQTKTLLSGIATGLSGAERAFNEKVLLSNTIQALQIQMRADRKEQAGVIYAKMFKANGITPISEYTLPMALSDVDNYYQAGTVNSALLGLQKTVASKEASSSQAKDSAGPNAAEVAAVKIIASPGPAVNSQGLTIIKSTTAPVRPVNVPESQLETRIGRYEKLFSKDVKAALAIIGCTGTDFGPAGSNSRKALSKFLKDNGQADSQVLTNDGFISLRELKAAGKQGKCEI
jgi:hypothetical protein